MQHTIVSDIVKGATRSFNVRSVRLVGICICLFALSVMYSAQVGASPQPPTTEVGKLKAELVELKRELAKLEVVASGRFGDPVPGIENRKFKLQRDIEALSAKIEALGGSAENKSQSVRREGVGEIVPVTSPDPDASPPTGVNRPTLAPPSQPFAPAPPQPKAVQVPGSSGLANGGGTTLDVRYDGAPVRFRGVDPFTYCPKWQADCVTTLVSVAQVGEFRLLRFEQAAHLMLVAHRLRSDLVGAARAPAPLTLQINGQRQSVSLFDFQMAVVWQSGLLRPRYAVAAAQAANMLPRYDRPLKSGLKIETCFSYDSAPGGLPVGGMGQAGLRPDIGYLEGRFAAYLARGGDQCAWDAAMSYAYDLARGAPWSISEPGSLLPIDFDNDWRGYTIHDKRSSRGRIDVFAGGGREFIRQKGIVAETNHMPQPFFGPFVLTGHPFFLMQMGYQGVFATGLQPGQFQGRGKYALVERYQERGGPSWTMRTLGMLALITPDSAPDWLVPRTTWKARFVANRDEFLRIIKVRDKNRPVPIIRQPANPYQTLIFPDGKKRVLVMAPWMVGYGQMSMGFLVAAGLQEAEVYRRALVQPLLNQFESPEFPNGLTAMYRLPLGIDKDICKTLSCIAKLSREWAKKKYPKWSGRDNELPAYGNYQQELHMVLAAQVKAGDTRFVPWLRWIESERARLEKPGGRVEYYGR
ncbi:MAG: hypothetical protein AAGF15_04385 [Pseudomonadota bacterium]